MEREEKVYNAETIKKLDNKKIDLADVERFPHNLLADVFKDTKYGTYDNFLRVHGIVKEPDASRLTGAIYRILRNVDTNAVYMAKLRYYECMSIRSIAQAYLISYKDVESAINRVLAELRKGKWEEVLLYGSEKPSTPVVRTRETLLRNIGLNERTVRALENAGYKTVEQVLKTVRDENDMYDWGALKAIRGFGIDGMCNLMSQLMNKKCI